MKGLDVEEGHSYCSFTSLVTVCTHSGLVFRQGTTLKLSPPAFSKSSLPSTQISSSVSRQSLTKAGHNTTSFLIPRLGIDLNSSTEKGSSHLSRPSLDWKEKLNLLAGIPSAAVTSL